MANVRVEVTGAWPRKVLDASDVLFTTRLIPNVQTWPRQVRSFQACSQKFGASETTKANLEENMGTSNIL